MRAWILKQKSLFYGNQTVYLCDDIMRVDSADIGVGTILQKIDGTWRLTIFINGTHEIYDGDFGDLPMEVPDAKALEELPPSVAAAMLNPPPFVKAGSEEIAGILTTHYTRSFPAFDNTLHYWATDSIVYPHARGAFFVNYQFLTDIPFPQVLLRTSSDGDGIDLDTQSCEQGEVSIENLLQKPTAFNFVERDKMIEKVSPVIQASGPHLHSAF